MSTDTVIGSTAGGSLAAPWADPAARCPAQAGGADAQPHRVTALAVGHPLGAHELAAPARAAQLADEAAAEAVDELADQRRAPARGAARARRPRARRRPCAAGGARGPSRRCRGRDAACAHLRRPAGRSCPPAGGAAQAAARRGAARPRPRRAACARCPLRRPAHVARQPDALQEADDRVGRVDLQRRSPWRAEVGNAWWLWCQPSPSDTSATTQLLRLSSSVTKGAARTCGRSSSPTRWRGA